MEDKDEKRNQFYRNDKEDYKITIQQLLHLFSLETPKFSANHIIICFWDYIARVINKKRLKDYSFCKINSRNFTYDGPT